MSFYITNDNNIDCDNSGYFSRIFVFLVTCGFFTDFLYFMIVEFPCLMAAVE